MLLTGVVERVGLERTVCEIEGGGEGGGGHPSSSLIGALSMKLEAAMAFFCNCGSMFGNFGI